MPAAGEARASQRHRAGPGDASPRRYRGPQAHPQVRSGHTRGRAHRVGRRRRAPRGAGRGRQRGLHQAVRSRRARARPRRDSSGHRTVRDALFGVAARIPSGVRARLLGVAALAVLPTFALIVMMAIEDRSEKTSSAYAEAARVVRLGVGEQRERVELAVHALITLSQSPETWMPDDPGCAAAARDMNQKLPMYSALGVARLDGEVVCSSLAAPRRTNFADREWFQRVVATRRVTVAGVSGGRLNGQAPVIVVALPLVDEGGVHAVAFAGLRFGWLGLLAREAQLGSGAAPAVVDARGTIVAREPAPESTTASRLADALVATILAKGAGTYAGVGPDRVERLYAFAPLVPGEDSAGLYLQVGLPRGAAVAVANRALRSEERRVG